VQVESRHAGNLFGSAFLSRYSCTNPPDSSGRLALVENIDMSGRFLFEGDALLSAGFIRIGALVPVQSRVLVFSGGDLVIERLEQAGEGERELTLYSPTGRVEIIEPIPAGMQVTAISLLGGGELEGGISELVALPFRGLSVVGMR
jgi:hypothetical protein